MRRYQTKKWKRKKLVILFLTVFFFFYLAVPALAESIQDLEKQKEISEQNIQNAQYTIDQEQSTIDGIEKEILESNKTIEALENEIGPLNEEISKLEADIAAAQKKLDETIAQETEQSELTDERLRVQYMYGSDGGYTEAMFSGDTVTEQVENAEIIGSVLESDQKILDELESTRQQVQQARSELDSRKAQLDEKKNALDAKLKQEQEIKAQQQDLLNKNEALIQKAKAQIAEEEASIARANDKIKELTAAAEREALDKQRREIKLVYNQAANSRDNTNQINNDISKSFQGSEDPEIKELVGRINSCAEKTVEQAKKIEDISTAVSESKTAAEAVEAGKDAEACLSVILENEAAAKEAKCQLTEVDLNKKKEQAQQAAQAAADERDAAIRAAQEEEKRQAEEAARKAEEEKKRAEQEAEEARRTAQERSSQTAVPSSLSSSTSASSSSGEFTDSFLSSTGWRWPLDGIFDITSVFGYRIHPIFGTGRGHEGIDIAASTGTPIHACDGGSVIYAGENGGYGNCVIVQQNNGYQVYYAHQSQMNVDVGQTVNKGDVVGYVGSTGWSTGPHLHLGVMTGEAFTDPFQFFPEIDSGQYSN